MINQILTVFKGCIFGWIFTRPTMPITIYDINMITLGQFSKNLRIILPINLLSVNQEKRLPPILRSFAIINNGSIR